MPEGKAILEVRGEDEFLKIVKENELVIVDFWAPWCAPCMRQKPEIKKVAKRYAGRIVVVSVNVDDLPSIARKYRIEAIPTLIIIRDGQEVWRAVGLRSADRLAQPIERVLAQK